MEQKRPAARVQQGFLHGAFILMFGVLLVKAIGALFKIPLSSIITEDGMGYFSTAYSFFNVLFSLSTVGFPVAVARLTAAEDALGHFRDVRQIKAAALPVFSVIGVLCALLMASFAPLYTHLVQSPGALFSMLALAPCAALCSISSVYRGYFEGLRNMLPTARSQVAESLGKLIFGLSGAISVMHMGTRELQVSGTVFGCTVKSEADGCQLVCALGAAAAILGVTLGAVLGLFLCAKGIGFLLNRYEQMTYSGILGFVVGSIFTLVPANFQLARDGLVCALVLIAGGLITYLFNRAGHS